MLRDRIRQLRNRWLRDFLLRLLLVSVVILSVFFFSDTSLPFRTIVLIPLYGICSALVFVPFRTWLKDQYQLHAQPTDERGLDLVLVHMDPSLRGEDLSSIQARILSDTLAVIERRPGWYPRIPWHLLSLMIVCGVVVLVPPHNEAPPAFPNSLGETEVTVPESKITVRPPAYVDLAPSTVPLRDVAVPQFAEVSIQTPCSTALTWLLRPEGRVRISESITTDSAGAHPPLHRENCIRTTSFDATTGSLFLVGEEIGADESIPDGSTVQTDGGLTPRADVVQRPVHISIRPDAAPEIVLLSPTAPATWSGGAYPLLKARISDDFGLQAVSVVWTRARGTGESVQFSESRRPIRPTAYHPATPPNRPISPGATPHEVTQSTYPLPFELVTSSAPWLERGQPGDIYYVYVEATDIGLFPWRTARSDVAIFVLPDTTDSPGSLPFTIPSDPVATALQSQRKLVMDIDTLLADDPAPTDLARRSRNLGMDQRTIRLQYGQYLGETDEGGTMAQIDRSSVDQATESPSVDDHAASRLANTAQEMGAEAVDHLHEDDHREDHHHENTPGADPFEAPFTQGEAQQSLADFQASLMHFHDSAETYQLYSDSVRATLKRALALMWDSERYLRTDQPRTARPYAVAALEHIKALQEHARIYVRKTAIRTPPISRVDQLTKALPGDISPTIRPTVDTALLDQVLSTLWRWELGMDAELPLDEIAQWSKRQPEDPSAFVRDLLRARGDATVRASVLQALEAHSARAYGFQMSTQP